MDNIFPYHSILIVCSVNTARSRMAEGFLRDFFTKLKVDITINSGGISSNARDGMIISMDAKLVMEEVGIKLSDTALSTDLKKHRELVNNADLILTLTNKHKEEIRDLFNINNKDILTIKEFAGERGDIEDPSMGGATKFGIARDEIIDCLMKGLNKYEF
ncbi:MAG: hypothetical protein ACFFDH_24540 [Promethearchaeota archaeon]